MGTSRKLKKHQHVVPRTYLNGWADSDGFVAVRDRGNTVPTRLPVSNIAVRKRFYNCIGVDGAETDAVENWLATDIEAPAGRSLKELRSGIEFGQVDQDAIIKFTVAQLIRTPTVFAIMDQLDEHLGAQLLLIDAARSGGFDLLALSAAERNRCLAFARQAWIEHGDGSTQESKLRTMVRTVDEVCALVESWHWCVLTASEPVLITGDSPVVTLNPLGYHWAGLLPEGSPLCMPLNPNVLLIGERSNPLREQKDLSADLASVVNSTVARQADRSLFGAPGLPWFGPITFPARKPVLSEPTVTWSAPNGPPTFPASYRPSSSAAVQSVLAAIGAVGTVE